VGRRDVAGRAAGLALALGLTLPGAAAGAAETPSEVSGVALRDVPPGAAGFEGYWAGTIETSGGAPLEVMLDLARDDGGGWRARFYAPAQGVHGVDLIDLRIAEGSIRFRIPRARGEPTFDGRLASDGHTLSGNFTDDDVTMPFHLARVERPGDLDVDMYAEYRKPGLPGVGLPGAWRALLVTGPNRMRLALEVRSAENGRLAGSLTSLDQGGAAQPIDAFRVSGDSVYFEMLGIGAAYDGKMRPDGSEFTGLWIQGGREFPLTFRRTGDGSSAARAD